MTISRKTISRTIRLFLVSAYFFFVIVKLLELDSSRNFSKFSTHWLFYCVHSLIWKSFLEIHDYNKAVQKMKDKLHIKTSTNTRDKDHIKNDVTEIPTAVQQFGEVTTGMSNQQI